MKMLMQTIIKYSTYLLLETDCLEMRKKFEFQKFKKFIEKEF